LNDRLRASEDAVAAFKLNHKIVSAGRDGTTQQLRVTDLNQQVSAARMRTEEANTRYQQAQRDLKANVDGPVKQDLLSTLRAQRSALNDQIAQKRAVFGDRHPDLVISYSQLSDINRQIENERKRNIESAKSEYEAMQDQQKTLENRLKSVEAEMLTEGMAFVKLQELQRDADANKNIYEQFLSRFKTTDEQRLLQSSQTKIASLATPPIRSTRPPLALLLAAIAIASTLISTAVVAMQNTKRNRPAPNVKTRRRLSPAEARPPHDMPIWARIPDLMPPDTDKTIWQTPISDAQERDLIPHLRLLLERIGSVQGTRGKVVLVTSVENGVGCSTIARALNLSALNRGLISVLVQVQPEGGFTRATRPAEASANGVSASKATLQSINRLLGADRNAGLPAAEDVRSEFDLIVIDAPSLAVQPDVASLSAHADLVILVVRDGAANPAAIRKARTSLWKLGSGTIGIVINQVSPDTVSALPHSEMLGMAS
jgi:Mrp family chromosome partitioning ATPase